MFFNFFIFLEMLLVEDDETVAFDPKFQFENLKLVFPAGTRIYKNAIDDF